MQVFKKIKYYLNQCCQNVYHLEANQEKNDYIVWREVSDINLYADDGITEVALRVAVDYFTKDEYPTVPELIKQRMCNIGCVKGPDIIYDSTSQRTQYSFTVEVY